MLGHTLSHWSKPWVILLSSVLFETEFHCVSKAGLKLIIQHRLASNLWYSSCLSAVVKAYSTTSSIKVWAVRIIFYYTLMVYIHKAHNLNTIKYMIKIQSTPLYLFSITQFFPTGATRSVSYVLFHRCARDMQILTSMSIFVKKRIKSIFFGRIHSTLLLLVASGYCKQVEPLLLG